MVKRVRKSYSGNLLNTRPVGSGLYPGEEMQNLVFHRDMFSAAAFHNPGAAHPAHNGWTGSYEACIWVVRVSLEESYADCASPAKHSTLRGTPPTNYCPGFP